jgi:NAD(P)H-flavin reductase
MTAAMTPLRYRIVDRRVELADTVTIELSPLDTPIAPYQAGQFTMVYAFGVGEVPISISGDSSSSTLVHTLRAVGAVTQALHDAPVGTVLGIRGPFGTSWGAPPPTHDDVVIIAGGIGLAPLRPAIRDVLRERDRYRRVCVLIGARTPADLLYQEECTDWGNAGAEVLVTVDRADSSWTGSVGVVPTLLDEVDFDPLRTTAYVCGPEVMMRFAAIALRHREVPAEAIRVSLERNMRCAIAWCGHCQLGPLLVCRDGPVVGYDLAEPLLAVKEL